MIVGAEIVREQPLANLSGGKPTFRTEHHLEVHYLAERLKRRLLSF